MGEKRLVPVPIQALLDWDTKATEKLVKLVDKRWGPLSKYKTHMQALEISCHGVIWFVSITALIFMFQSVPLRHLCVNLFLALLLDVIIVAIIKAIARRRRPPTYKAGDMFTTVGPDKFSFPSGHATRAVLLSVLLPVHYEMFMPLTLALVTWSASVCASRVLLGRHHILDVAAGIFIGMVQALAFNSLWLDPDSAISVTNYLLNEQLEGASFGL